MAIIDYHSIKSLIFAKLTKSSRILIPVLSALCNDFDGSLSKEHSKHHVLAMYAGLATSSVKIALADLKAHNIISIHTTIGHPAAIIYIPAATLHLSSKNSLASRSSATQLADNRLPMDLETPPQTPVDKEPVTHGTDVAERSLNNERLKQQPTEVAFLNNQFLNKQDPKIVLLAELIGHALVKQKMAQKGSAFVVDLLKAISGRKGEIDDPAAYFVSCCTKDIIPRTRKQKAESLAKKKRQQRELYEEAERQRWEREKQCIITEQNDPEAQARVRAAQENFWATMGEPERVHNPPA